MNNYQQLQEQFAQTIKTCLSGSRTSSELDASLSSDLISLVDALPYYGNIDFLNCHRAALINLLEVNLPNNRIAAHPNEGGIGYSSVYVYAGPFSGYRSAFYGDVTISPAASAVAAQVQAAVPALNSAWWGNYGVAALTDAIRLALSPSLNTAKLTNDLTSNNTAFLQALAASYLGVYAAGYTPTREALCLIVTAGQSAAAASLLAAAITQGQFTSNINEAIAMGGDSSSAAVWFLFNLWITLRTLGETRVDDCIAQAKTAGLTVPAQVGPGTWWNGGYTNWYSALGGSDVAAQASSIITACMPEEETTGYSTGIITSHVDETNGYSKSLYCWGDLNWYKPQPTSCFGKGTQVLMADGSSRAIETIVAGDEVRSSLGIRKVALVESPRRQGRPLYQINGLPLFATSAHPFRSGEMEHGMRVAIDPWALIDSLPSMTESGVASLSTGGVLTGLINGRSAAVPIISVSEHFAGDDTEQVYDLLLEDWAQGYATYYVGGPASFLAADAETADPGYDLPCTVAMVEAMYSMIDVCRANFVTADSWLTEAIANLTLAGFSAPVAANFSPTERIALPRLPKTDFFIHNGQWDSRASQLEAQLVRIHARAIRRLLHDPLHGSSAASESDAHFGICLHDIELLGEHGVAAGAALSLELRLRSSSTAEDRPIMIDLGASAAPRWLILYDGLIDLDGCLPASGKVVINGILRQNSDSLGVIRLSVDSSVSNAPCKEHFIHDASGKIIGRIALREVRISVQQTTGAEVANRQRSQTKQMNTAVSLGQHLGQLFGQSKSKGFALSEASRQLRQVHS